MPIKNNITRLLDSRNIKYKIHVTPAEKRSAVETAGRLGVDPEIVYKTIVAIRPKSGKPILAIIPGPSTLDLKALAKILEVKKILLSTQAEAEKLTGLQTGGISPLALINKGFQIFMDHSCEDHKNIFISGGERGITLQLQPDDLKSITNAKIVKISK